ncbi:hypothetical protein VNO77_19869 [Canavalia gladiata]|uniref:Uncharacterized protein n=1 Tax=Canavalia gladiata TaxID=3824 RepID=A0AAN9QKT3_CANGL
MRGLALESGEQGPPTSTFSRGGEGSSYSLMRGSGLPCCHATSTPKAVLLAGPSLPGAEDMLPDDLPNGGTLCLSSHNAGAPHSYNGLVHVPSLGWDDVCGVAQSWRTGRALYSIVHVSQSVLTQAFGSVRVNNPSLTTHLDLKNPFLHEL